MGTTCQKSAGDGPPRRVLYTHIGEQEVDFLQMLLDFRNRLFLRSRFQYVVSSLGAE